MTVSPSDSLQHALNARFQDAPDVSGGLPDATTLARLTARASCRAFTDQPVPDDWLDLLCATALSAPTKSDLQQRDLIVLRDPDQRTRLAALVSEQSWVAAAPMLLVFCGNNRRQRLVQDRQGIPFANDHLDAAFNAIGDAALALGAFLTAAEALGLGCCPISAVRNEANAVAELLRLPDHVFPFAGLAVGYPAKPPEVAMRLPLSVTCHTDSYQEHALEEAITSYDATRAQTQPYARQRSTDIYGEVSDYGWCEDKARQYGLPERAGFGAYLRRIGFRLD